MLGEFLLDQTFIPPGLALLPCSFPAASRTRASRTRHGGAAGGTRSVAGAGGRCSGKVKGVQPAASAGRLIECAGANHQVLMSHIPIRDSAYLCVGPLPFYL